MFPLQRHLPQVDRIVLIGWRAGEAHFVSLLKKFIPGSVPVQVVAGGREPANEILARMRDAGIADPDLGTSADGGFSQCVESRAAETFLK
jgi:hypothetical protein